MVQHHPLLAALPTAVLDVTTDLAPLLMAMVIGLFLCVLAIAVIIGVHDSWGTQPSAMPPTERPQPASEFSDAA